MRIVVSGSNGNLSHYIKEKSKDFIEKNKSEFYFFNKKELDITDHLKLQNLFKYIKPNYFINTSAYTNVDLAEKNMKECFDVNVNGPKNLSLICNLYNSTLIHYSTDYVYDGLKTSRYKENDNCNPISYYGKTKYFGDMEIYNNMKKYYIFRVSWLIDSFGSNFLTKIINNLLTKKEINVVDDQVSLPTFYDDLAEITLEIIFFKYKKFGLYNYSTIGKDISRYKFTRIISKYLIDNNIHIGKINSILTSQIDNIANRPMYSSLDCSKFERTFNINLINWEKCIKSTINNYLDINNNR